EVVSKTRHVRHAAESRLHRALEPEDEHFMKKDVREYWRDHPALRHSGLRVVETPLLHHASIEPLADEAQQHAITYPLAQHLAKLGALHRSEEVFDVGFEHPAVAEVHRLFPDCL